MSTFRVAVTQHEPAWLSLPAAVAKTTALIAAAAAAHADLLVFPECWIPGYPAWIWSRPVDFALATRYVEASLPLDSPEFRAIAAAAAEHGIAVSLGFSERHHASVYIAQALISPRGELLAHRRKMKPTHMERTVFGDATGDASCLADVPALAPRDDATGGAAVRVSALSCWEHIQPLLKFHVLSQAPQVHAAAWPVLDGFVEGSPGLWSMSVEGCRALSQTFAVESGAFVAHATTTMSAAGAEAMGTTGSPMMGGVVKGSSAVFGPDGRLLVDGADKSDEQLLFAELDLRECLRAKTFADAAGHYSRPDLMWLGVDKSGKGLVRET